MPVIEIKYEQTRVPGWSGLVCKISSAGVQFVSLGLEKGQSELTQQQQEWITKHTPTICGLCEGIAALLPLDFKAKDKVELYKKLTAIKHELLEQFCQDCGIKDS